MKSFLFDHLVLAVLVVSVSVSLLLHPVSPLWGSILYFVLPSAYLVARKPCIWRLALTPALLFGFLYGLSFEYINEVSGAWVFPLAHTFVIPDIFFGVPGDVMVWYVLWIFMIVAYYEYFIDRPFVCTLVLRRVYKAILLGLLPIAVIIFFELVLLRNLTIPFSYTITGLATLLPVYVLYMRKPRIFPKLMKNIPFLAIFFLLMESVALWVGYWEFPGTYAYSFDVYGHVVPIEELLLWVIGSPLIIAAYHELFLDDER